VAAATEVTYKTFMVFVFEDYYFRMNYDDRKKLHASIVVNNKYVKISKF